MPSTNVSPAVELRAGARQWTTTSRGGLHVSRRSAPKRGAVLVEFALIAVAFYLLMAGTIEIGRMVFASQILQNAARVGARELAMVPLPPTYTFGQALAENDVKAFVYDPSLLCFDVGETDDDVLQATIAGWPVVNRMLAPLMINERVKVGGVERHLLRYPGALVLEDSGSLGVLIPQLAGNTVTLVPVVEEIVPAGGPELAPFSLESAPGKRERGLVALRINYPFQAATMSAYTQAGGINTPVLANDDALTSSGPETEEIESLSGHATYDGKFGLGKQYALLQEVRPFRRLLSAQSIFRREVYSATPP